MCEALGHTDHMTRTELLERIEHLTRQAQAARSLAYNASQMRRSPFAALAELDQAVAEKRRLERELAALPARLVEYVGECPAGGGTGHQLVMGRNACTNCGETVELAAQADR